MPIEKLVRNDMDFVRWSGADILQEGIWYDTSCGIRMIPMVRVARVQWRGRTIDMIEPQSDGIGIDLDTGEIVDVSGLW